MAQARFDSLRTLAFGGISAVYAAVGASLTHSWRTVKFTNNTNGDLFISTDGSTDMIFLAAGSFTLYDVSANVPNVGDLDNLLIPKTTQFYARQSTAPSSGALWIEGMYAKGE